MELCLHVKQWKGGIGNLLPHVIMFQDKGKTNILCLKLNPILKDFFKFGASYLCSKW